MENFDLNNLELNLEEDVDLDDMFELSSVEDNEVIEEEHFKLATKDFLHLLKKAKTIISASARDLITKSVCMQVIDNELVLNVTDFDVYLEVKAPIINTANILEDVVICPIDTLLQLAKALPSTTTILKEGDKYKIRLIGGSIDIETLSLGRDKFILKDDLVEDKSIDANDLFKILNAFTPIVQSAVNPMEKRILFNEDGARAFYMFTMVMHAGNFPQFDVKIKDLQVLKALLSSAKGKLRTYRTADDKASKRFVIQDDVFKYTFLVGEVKVNRILEDNFNQTNFNSGGYVEFANIFKLVELSSTLNYATGKVKMKFSSYDNLELKVPTKNGDNTFNLDVTANGNIEVGVCVEVPSKMLFTILKTFQKNTVLSIYANESRVVLSNNDFRGLVLLDA